MYYITNSKKPQEKKKKKLTKFLALITRLLKDIFIKLMSNYGDITIEGIEKTSGEMKEYNFVQMLNDGNETNIWKIEGNLNQGYPVLYWE